MRTFASVLAAAAVLAAVSASCPNMCSGHGSCTTDDQCLCWKGYEGYDCSKRSCPMVEAWAADSVEGAHKYAECAGKGLCDYTSGICQCFDGFEGRGCERSTCPNGCSGHGQCRRIIDLPNYIEGRNEYDRVTTDIPYAWDEKAITACVCDGGYSGPDCSQRICPHGDDPMTVCEQGDTQQKQVIGTKFHTGLTTLTDGELRNTDIAFRFKSYANDEFYTHPMDFIDTNIEPAAGKEAGIKAAFESIPNQRIKSVAVSADTTRSTTGVNAQYIVTFNHENGSGNNYGEQNLIMCPHPREFGVDSSSSAGSNDATNDNKKLYTYGCAAAGCQPKIKQPRIESYYELTDSNADNTLDTVTAKTSGTGDVVLTDDSVLTCPVGQTCSVDVEAANKATAALIVVTGLSGGSKSVWAKAVSDENTHTGVLSDNLGGSFTLAVGGTTDTALANALYTLGFKHMGEQADFSGSAPYTVDMSSLIPDTRVSIATAAWDAAIVQANVIQYVPVQCMETVDVTESGGGSAVDVAFQNVDAENIECSGRGDCDRTSGNCACFEGFTGLACTEQTILV